MQQAEDLSQIPIQPKYLQVAKWYRTGSVVIVIAVGNRSWVKCEVLEARIGG